MKEYITQCSVLISVVGTQTLLEFINLCCDMVQLEVTRRRKKLLDDLGDRRGYSHLKEEALDRIKWRNRFGRGFGPVV